MQITHQLWIRALDEMENLRGDIHSLEQKIGEQTYLLRDLSRRMGVQEMAAAKKDPSRDRITLKDCIPLILPVIIFLSLLLANVPVKDAVVSVFRVSKTASTSQ